MPVVVTVPINNYGHIPEFQQMWMGEGAMCGSSRCANDEMVPAVRKDTILRGTLRTEIA